MVDNFPTIFNRVVPTIDDLFVKKELEKLGPGKFLSSIGFELNSKSDSFFIGSRKPWDHLRGLAVDLCTPQVNGRFSLACNADQYKALKTVIGNFFDNIRLLYLDLERRQAESNSKEFDRQAEFVKVLYDGLDFRSRGNEFFDERRTANILLDFLGMLEAQVAAS